MKNNYKILIGILLVSSIFLVSCAQSEDINANSEGEDLKEEIESLNMELEERRLDNKKLEEENQELSQKLEELEEDTSHQSLNNSLILEAMEVMDLIKNKDMEELANRVHPSKGLRFTPYFYIDSQNDQVFTSQEVEVLNTDTNIYNWGSYDGTGDPIDLSFEDYYDEFVYDKNFINPHIIGNNTAIGSGNALDNIDDEYPNGEYVEFHFTGFEAEYAGMDWASLRLVFEEDGGVLYLVGIIHGQWTI